MLYQEQVVQLLCQLLNTSFEQFLGVLMMSRNPKTIEGLSKPANSNGSGNGSGGGEGGEIRSNVEEADPVAIGPGQGSDTPLDILCTTWATGVRYLDDAPSLLMDNSVAHATVLLVRQLSRLLNAIGTKSEAASGGDGTGGGAAMDVSAAATEVHKWLIDSMAPTLSRWETGHHHVALKECSDDLYEVMTTHNSYF